MGLFNVVPSSFFSVLSSPNKELYVEALLNLNEMFRYGVNIELEDYQSSLILLLEIREYIAENSDEKDISSMPIRQKARLILERFKNTGWIFIESKDGTFKEVISLYDHSIKTLKLIEQLSNPTVKEYNSLVFSTYSSLKQAIIEDNDKMYDALIVAKDNSITLMDELKSLFHNIRNYYNNVIGTDNINELLKNQFDEYQPLIDKIYHPIKTTDSVHRFSLPIKQMLREIEMDDKILETMVKKAVHEDEQLALEQIYKDINDIINIFNGIPKLIEEIDRKHAKYSKVSMEKISYMLSGDKTIKGKLITLLKKYQENENEQDTLLAKMQEAIHADSQENLNKDSLWHKSAKSRRIIAEPLEIEKVDSEKMAIKYKKFLDKTETQYPDEKINDYINKLLDGKNQIITSDIELKDDSDFICLILATIKFKHKIMNFDIQFSEGNIYKNGYSIPNAIISRKE